MIIPQEWLPAGPMKRVHLHWTAGHHDPNAVDLRAYHMLVTGKPEVVRGRPSIALNSGSLQTGYAAHTLNANTNAIGLSICGMAGAVESPFDPGRAPFTEAQFRHAAKACAVFCEAYGIPVSSKTTLTHAEVDPTLGIRQRWKWDIARLPWSPSVQGAIAIGDLWRDMVSDEIDKDKRAGKTAKATAPAPYAPTQPESDPIPEGAQGRVTASALNFRVGAGTGYRSTGQIPRDTVLIVEAVQPGWLQVTTPAGYNGWVARQHVEIFDGPPVEEATEPNINRQRLDQMQALIDDIRADIGC